jgi:uncharacterized protein
VCSCGGSSLDSACSRESTRYAERVNLTIIFPLVTGLFAGVLGAMLGLGGGVIVVPALTILGPRFGVGFSLQTIIAASQVGVLAVAVASSAGNLRQAGLIRLHDAYRLAPFTVFGGVTGSLLGLVLEAKAVATVFSILLVYTGTEMLRSSRRKDLEVGRAPRWTPPAVGFGGVMSGLLGVGGGTVQVPVLNMLFGMPFRTAVATSTFMMGLTAIANALIYTAGGKLDPVIAGPVALGILIGARVGAILAKRVPVNTLKIMFSVLVFYSAYDLLHKYWGFGF